MYFFDLEEQVLDLCIFGLNFIYFVSGKNFPQILTRLRVLLILHYFLDGVKMVILKNISLEFFDFLSAEGTAMMAADGLFDAKPTKHMATSGYIGVVDGI